MDFITAVRNIRGEMNISPARPLPVLVSGKPHAVERVRRFEELISSLARLESWEEVTGEAPDGCATGVVEDLRLFIPLAGLVDISAEISRLEKEIARWEKDLTRVTRKLENPNFLAKANPEVVEKERRKSAEIQEKLAGLSEALERLRAV